MVPHRLETADLKADKGHRREGWAGVEGLSPSHSEG